MRWKQKCYVKCVIFFFVLLIFEIIRALRKLISPQPIPWHIDGLVYDCSNSIAITLELLQSRTKPSICYPRIKM